ncbi:MAG: hypothetical protein ABI340_02725 [Nitrososphaera sp.]|jgi:hypothetical protein
MTYYTIRACRGKRSEVSRLLELGYISAIKNTAEFREFVEIISEALKTQPKEEIEA